MVEFEKALYLQLGLSSLSALICLSPALIPCEACLILQQSPDALPELTHVYATDSTVLNPPSTMSFISRADKPATPYKIRQRESSTQKSDEHTSSTESGVGAPGPPLPSPYADWVSSASPALMVLRLSRY